MSDFQVGDLVEVIDASGFRYPGVGCRLSPLILGDIHEVLDKFHSDGADAVSTDKAPATIADDGVEDAYSTHRFRKVYRPKADLITRLLEKPVKAPEVVS